MADGLIKIQGSTNVGKCVDAINDNFEYLDGKTPAGEDILEQAKAYTNFRADAISSSTNEALQARVMKETGKGLSTNDYTNSEKAKLEGIEAGANKTIVDSAWDINSANPVQNKMIIAALQSQSDALNSSCNALNASIQSLNKKSTDLDRAKVDKVEGKGLSSNDYTDEEKDKLAGVEENANNYVHPYGTCITDAGNPAKSVTLDGFKLAVGKKITVIFTNANTADAITLNVNGTGAKPVYYIGTAMTYKLLRIPSLTGVDFIYDGTNWVYCGQQSYVSQTNAADNANYRLLLSFTGDNVQERAPTKKSGNFTANPSTGVLSAKYFKQSQSGTLLAENSTNENSLTVTNAEIAKYSQVYMAASWTQQETVNFCDVIPISAIVAGAVFTKQVYTGTRIYTYTVTCTSAGVFTLTQTNSTGTAGTLRLKLYVI